MAYFRCTNCGEIFEAAEGMTSTYCPHCGAQQLLPGAFDGADAQSGYSDPNAQSYGDQAPVQGDNQVYSDQPQGQPYGAPDYNVPGYGQQPYNDYQQGTNYAQNPVPNQPGGINYPGDGNMPAPPKKGMSKGLLIGLIIGGAALLIVIIAVVAIVISANSAKPNIIPGNNTETIAIGGGDDITVTGSENATVSAGGTHTVGIKSDGTVIAVGNNGDGQCDVSGWSNIVTISAGYEHTLGVQADGKVVATGSNVFGQCDVSTWSNIKSVAAGTFHSLGLKNDGTVVAAGDEERRHRCSGRRQRRRSV